MSKLTGEWVRGGERGLRYDRDGNWKRMEVFRGECGGNGKLKSKIMWFLLLQEGQGNRLLRGTMYIRFSLVTCLDDKKKNRLIHLMPIC